MAKKRITELATETTLKDGQYVAIDHTTDGTKKLNIGAELTDLKEDLDNIFVSDVRTPVAPIITKTGQSVYYSGGKVVAGSSFEGNSQIFDVDDIGDTFILGYDSSKTYPVQVILGMNDTTVGSTCTMYYVKSEIEQGTAASFATRGIDVSHRADGYISINMQTFRSAMSTTKAIAFNFPTGTYLADTITTKEKQTVTFLHVANTMPSIVVAKDGSGDYTTISEAIAGASNEDTIYIKDGEYHETVVVNKYLHLVGQSKQGTILYQDVGDYDNSTIAITQGSLSNMTIKSLAPADTSGLTDYAYAVHLDKNFASLAKYQKCEIYNCDIYSEVNDAIGAGTNYASEYDIHDCRVWVSANPVKTGAMAFKCHNGQSQTTGKVILKNNLFMTPGANGTTCYDILYHNGGVSNVQPIEVIHVGNVLKYYHNGITNIFVPNSYNFGNSVSEMNELT